MNSIASGTSIWRIKIGQEHHPAAQDADQQDFFSGIIPADLFPKLVYACLQFVFRDQYLQPENRDNPSLSSSASLPIKVNLTLGELRDGPGSELHTFPQRLQSQSGHCSGLACRSPDVGCGWLVRRKPCRWPAVYPPVPLLPSKPACSQMVPRGNQYPARRRSPGYLCAINSSTTSRIPSSRNWASSIPTTVTSGSR